MEFIKKLIQHELISGSFYLFLGGMVGNFFAFLLNLFLARSLSYADYGIFASLLSVITLACIPAGSINTIIVKFATSYHAKQQLENISAFYFYCAKILIGASAFFLFLFIVLAFPLSAFLHLNNIWYGIVLSFAISIFYLNGLNLAFLQSLLKFGFISFVNSFGGFIKLVAGVLFVFLGLRAFSGLWAIFFMAFGSFLIAFIPLRKILMIKTHKQIHIPTKEILKYSVPTFFTVLFLTSFTSIDVILVKHFFSAQAGGFYAGLSLLGKVIFYFTAPIPAVMFPLLVKRHTLNQNYKKLFYLALILVFLPSVAITLFYFIRPEFVINIFLGGREYLSISKYLGIFGLYLTIFSLVNIFVNFFLSINKTKISFLVIMAAVLQIVLINIYHADFYQVIGASIFSSTFLLVSLFFIFLKSRGSFGKLKEKVAFLNTPSV